MNEKTEKEEERSVRLLSFDGGGVSGLSSLIILQEFMKRLQGHQNLPDTPRPCEWFDMIAGTGTGGIIAILLGRLGLRVEEAIEAYREILGEAFSEKKLFGDDATFKATNLENAIGRVVARYAGSTDAQILDHKAVAGGCKTFVCAMLANNMRAGVPVLLRTYKVLENDGPKCTIIQAARATSAMAGLFKPVTIDELGIKIAYVDGGLGSNNPTGHMLAEAGRLFADRNVSCVLSIGAGHLQPMGLSNPEGVKKLGMDLAMDSERIAQEMAQRFQYTTDLYFRFNVDQGLQHIGATSLEKLAEVATHSRQYTQLFEVDSRLTHAVKTFAAGTTFIPATQLSGIIPPTDLVKALRSCPPPSPAFTGQEEVLGQMHNCIFDGSDGRHVFILHGLGGAGKTQLALKFAQMHRDRFSNIFYVDATSTKTIEADLASLAVAKKAGKSPRDAIAWLAGQRERWLLIYNNADDTSLNLRSYLPPCERGDIVITTRNRELIGLAQGADAHRQLSRMQPEDGKRLLLRLARVAASDQADELAEVIVNELGCLALAIVQAGAYICVHECGLAAYLDMYRDYRGELLEQYRDLTQKLDDYRWTVYTTWGVSLKMLSSRAVKLFHLLAFMHHERISEETFRRACLKAATQERPATDNPPDPEDDVVNFLSGFGASSRAWYRPAFLNLMAEIRSYSLVDFDPLSGTYSIHPLVQSWIRTTVELPSEVEKSTASLLALSVEKEFDSQDHEYRAKLTLHIDALSPRIRQADPKLARKFAMVYDEAGRYQTAKVLQVAVVEAGKHELGDDHPDTLTDMFSLANIYQSNGEYEEAERLQVTILDARKRVLGESHPDTYRTLAYLALTYYEQCRFQEAVPLQVQVLEAAKQLLGPEARETLQSQHALAATYEGMGRIREAELLLVELVEVEKRALGSNHPVTLTSMHNLAHIFNTLNKLDEAESLAAHVLETRKQTSGPSHPDTLSCLSIIAGIRYAQGRWEDAATIQTELDNTYGRTLGEMHPAALSNKGNLACTYQQLGRISEAEQMYRQVLDARIKMQGSEHPGVLSAIINLSGIYYTSLGRTEEAEKMMLDEINARSRRPFNNNIIGTADLQNNLADLYTTQKRWKEAEVLMQGALATQTAVLGPEHGKSVHSRRALAIIQQNMRSEKHKRLAYPLAGTFVVLLSVVLAYLSSIYRFG